MSALSPKELRECWIANAQRLDQRETFRGDFTKATRGGLAEGMPSASGRPIGGLRSLGRDVALGYALRTPKFVDNMRDFKVVGVEVREKTLSILDELPPESYEPPYELEEPPGYPFVFHSNILGCVVYFKFQIEGSAKNSRVLFWSCHPPLSKRKQR